MPNKPTSGKSPDKKPRSKSVPAILRRDARPAGQTLSEEIIGLDQELLRILTRRTQLLGKLRKGKPHATTKAQIQSEKEIRSAWESRAATLSRDSRFIRNFFSLMQDLELLPPEEQDRPAFNLAPVRQPVKIEMPGPGMTAYAMLWTMIAASRGEGLKLPGLKPSADIVTLTKALNQAGVSASWRGNDLEIKPGKGIDLLSKATYCGDDPLCFNLLAFSALNKPGRPRFTGGPALKDADLSPLSRALPSFGARLAWVIPGSKGLPLGVECSGQLPESYTVPADLPLESVLGLLLAPLIWNENFAVDLEALPGNIACTALSMFGELAAMFSGQVEINIAKVKYSKVEQLPALPEVVPPVMDPMIAAYLLAMPFFCGGSCRLEGEWPEVPEASGAIGFLRRMFLKVKMDSKGIGSASGPNVSMAKGFNEADLPDDLHPLFWAANGRIALHNRAGLMLREFPEGADLALAAEFLAQFGVSIMHEGPEGVRLARMTPAEAKKSASRQYGWTSPGYTWTLALSLAAFSQSNLLLCNPDSATDVLPVYWYLYNNLPEPKLAKERKAAAAEPVKKGRRIKTVTVIEPDEAAEADE